MNASIAQKNSKNPENDVGTMTLNGPAVVGGDKLSYTATNSTFKHNATGNATKPPRASLIQLSSLNNATFAKNASLASRNVTVGAKNSSLAQRITGTQNEDSDLHADLTVDGLKIKFSETEEEEDKAATPKKPVLAQQKEEEKSKHWMDYKNLGTEIPEVQNIRRSLKAGIMEYDSYMRQKGELIQQKDMSGNVVIQDKH
jgi:uncharacterized glyoxalase superfamily protein PhnB